MLLSDEPAPEIVVQSLVPSWLYGLRGSDDIWTELSLEGLLLLLVSESQSEKVSATGPPLFWGSSSSISSHRGPVRPLENKLLPGVSNKDACRRLLYFRV